MWNDVLYSLTHKKIDKGITHVSVIVDHDQSHDIATGKIFRFFAYHAQLDVPTDARL